MPAARSTRPGSIVEDGDRIQIAAPDHERAAELLGRVQQRLATERCIADVRSSGVRRHRPVLSRMITASTSSGVRFGAKTALAFSADMSQAGFDGDL